MKEPCVYIIILNYNGYSDTIECIKSLELIEYKNYKIVVVDNKSTDESVKFIKNFISKNEKINLIESESNLGFSGGNNLGIEYALMNNAGYICLLNNDTVVEPDFLGPLVNIMETDANIGISGGKIMYHKNKNIVWAAGGYIEENKAIGVNYGIDKNENDVIDEIREVTFLTGCLQVIRREVFQNIGLYDDEYFLYMEDVDFCKRALEHGYKLIYDPNSKIYHKVSASTGGKVSPMVVYYMTRNRLLFNSKYSESKINSLRFYIFYFIKILTEPARKKVSYKYVMHAIKDFYNKKFGYKDLEKI